MCRHGESKRGRMTHFDILTKPEIKLTTKKRNQVKKAARKLLETLKQEKLVLDWRKRQQSRAAVKVTIEQVLDEELPPAYTPKVYDLKTNMIFQHVYDAYYGQGKSIYAA